jgi:hypothetical protein
MMHRNRFRTYLGRARPVTGLAFLVLCTILVLAFVAMVDDRAAALWSPLSPLESPVSPTPDTSRAKESLTPTVGPPEATQAKPTRAEPAQAEATQAAPTPSEVKQSPAWRSPLGIGMVVLGLALVIGGVFWLVRRR